MDKRFETCASFPPVYTPGCRVLVLGSMPGVASLRAAQYYAHPRNAFWPILYALWGREPPEGAYEARLRFAREHGVAIWDVAKTCLRQGSSDASIRQAEANDFPALFKECPDINTIFHNGRLSKDLFDRLCGDALGVRRVLLPSTSPAYTLPFAEKLSAWRPVREAAEREA